MKISDLYFRQISFLVIFCSWGFFGEEDRIHSLERTESDRREVCLALINTHSHRILESSEIDLTLNKGPLCSEYFSLNLTTVYIVCICMYIIFIIMIGISIYSRERSSSPEYRASRSFARPLFLIVENEGFARKEKFARSLGIRQLFAYSNNVKVVGIRQISFFLANP